MARPAKKKQEDFNNVLLWFLDSPALPKKFQDCVTDRPPFFAEKIPVQFGYRLNWVAQLDKLKCVPIGYDQIYKHLAAMAERMCPESVITEKKIKDLVFRIEASLETPFNEMTRHAILLEDRIKPIAFADEDCFCFERIDCPKPTGTFQVEPGKVNYDNLVPYWRLLLERMADYNEETDQSTFFEMLLMCLAEAFCGTGAPKVVPYIFGSRNAGKTGLMNDIGSLFGDAFAPAKRIDKISQEYYVASLKGKRLVHCDESPKGDVMSEDLKALTGGSEWLEGRPPASRPITFYNTIMLWITSNHPPLMGKDEATRARYRIIEINSLKPHLRMPNVSQRRQSMVAGLPEVLEIGLGLKAFYGGEIPESSEELIEESISDENDEIMYQINSEFVYRPGTYTPHGVIVEWARLRRHNITRVEECLAKLQPHILNVNAQQSGKVEKARKRLGSQQMRVWTNICKLATPIQQKSFDVAD